MAKTEALAREVAHAKAAGLMYVSDQDPGISRYVKGKGFRYRGPNGEPVAAEHLARIQSLAIPPAWSEVWISPLANGHIQATGRDARGRKQYRYHDQWRVIRDLHKFEHTVEFARLLPKIRARVASDMKLPGTPREKVLATIVSLLDKTLIRVGNVEYARENRSYGLTTLKARHLSVNGSELRFEFKGKSGKTWRLPLKDRRIARIVGKLQELPGQHLFKYLDEGGAVTSVDSADVNTYLREIADADVSAKDFRTWAGTVLAAGALSVLGTHETETQAKGQLKRAIQEVAARLGNTVTISRKCYVHPEVVACYLEGVFPKLEPAPGDRDAAERGQLSSIEQAVLQLLEERLDTSTPRVPSQKAAKGT
jgi:DNA topoisomerase I